MKTIVLPAPNRVEYHDVDIPQISPDEVLLRVVVSGICGGDAQVLHGQHRFVKFPTSLGHEPAAVVEKVGGNVVGFKVGDRVTAQPQKVCGKCYLCRIGRPNLCENLKIIANFHAEYAARDYRMLHLCPDDMPFDQIALVEPLAVGVGSVKRARCKGKKVCVVGAGTIGNLIAQCAVAFGASDVMVADLIESKLAYARRCGIRHCANIQTTPLSEAIVREFGDSRADVIVDAAANKAAFDAILAASRPSSEIVITGNYKVNMDFDVTRIQRREVSMIGHYMYVREDFQDAIRMLHERTVYTEGFITARYPLTKYHEAAKFIDENPDKVMKVLLDPSMQ